MIFALPSAYVCWVSGTSASNLGNLKVFPEVVIHMRSLATCRSIICRIACQSAYLQIPTVESWRDSVLPMPLSHHLLHHPPAVDRSRTMAEEGSSSFNVGASASGPGLGNGSKEAQPRKHRKLNRSQPQLKRNAACLPCRRRRIKCDAGKPHCSSCTRSFQFLQRTNPDPARDSQGVQCFYEEEEDEDEEQAASASGSGALSGDRLDDPKVAVKKLEARVGESRLVAGSTRLLTTNRGTSKGITRDSRRRPVNPASTASISITSRADWMV